MSSVIKLKNNTYLYGTIIDKGSNSYGKYMKYSDGTLIQYGTVSKTAFLNENNNYTLNQGINWYRSSNTEHIIFPHAFIDFFYTISITIKSGTNGTRLIVPRIDGKDKTFFCAQLISVEPFNSNGGAYSNLESIEWVAIGKWK